MLLAALFAAPLAHAEAYALADAGITLDLPSGWEMREWSDWDFKARTGDQSVAIEAWYTNFQVPVDKEAAERWAGVYAEKLDAMRADGVRRDAIVVEEIAGRPTAKTTMRFSLEKGGPKGAMFVAAFPVEGKVVHVATLAVGGNVAKAESALATLLQRLTVQKPAANLLELGGTVETELGFSAVLPEGWRRPLPSEEKEALASLADVGIGPKEPEACMRAIHPRPTGEADLMVFCSETWKTGILDENSFADQEILLRQRYFGKAAEKVPAAQQLQRNDRLGFLLAPEINGHDLRIVALPYDRGTVVAWAVGEPGTGEALTSAVRATAMSLTFSGPEGGASVHEAGEWILHVLTYDPFHPAVLGSGLFFVAMLGGIGWLMFRKPSEPPPVA